MRRSGQGWLHKPNVSWLWASCAIVIWAGVLIGLDRTQVAEDLESRVSRPLDFRVREMLGHSPTMDPRIKVYVVDDTTFAWLGGPMPSIEQLADLLEGIAARQPKMVAIDAIFSVAKPTVGRERQYEEAIRRLERIKVPILGGSFMTPAKIPGREGIATDRPEFDLRRMLVGKFPNERARDEVLRRLRLVTPRGGNLYGPAPEFRGFLRQIGHIQIDDNHRIAPYLRIGPNKGLPHFMLLSEPKRRFFQGQLYLGRTKVPISRDGSVPVNFSPFSTYAKSSRRLVNLLLKAQRKEPLSEIKPGDYVYIIPNFFTGNTDFQPTPFGPMPGGFVHLAVLNSVLQGNWLNPVWAKEVLIVAGAALGAGIAYGAGPLLAALGLLSGVGIWIAIAMALFTFKGMVVPWMLPAISYIGVLVAVYFEKTRVAEKKAQFIRNALDGAVAPTQLEALAKRPESINFEARERVVTVMFIDIVGFSLLAENQLPRIAFDHLKTTFADITKLVHQHGGIVNKNLGDGLLCFFGYSLETDSSSLDHAEKAIECAIAIQRDNLPKTLVAHERGEPIYPLRIGVNTASVFLGNIGNETRIDFTVVGNGVNFAKRLEGACDTHSVMMGATTRELIETLGLDRRGLKKRYIQIKHHDDMVEAYEFDPFFEQHELREQAIQVYRTTAKLARVKKRWVVERPELMLVSTNVGEATLVNFSLTGLSVKLPTSLVKGTVIKLRIDSIDGRFAEKLEENEIRVIECEVRWAYQEGDLYLHGVKFKSINDVQASYLVQQLRLFVTSGTDDPKDFGKDEAS